jgi:hypothetical protein
MKQLITLRLMVEVFSFGKEDVCYFAVIKGLIIEIYAILSDTTYTLLSSSDSLIPYSGWTTRQAGQEGNTAHAASKVFYVSKNIIS